MRQTDLRAVAPLNTNPMWPEGYIGVLRDMGAVEKLIPYFVVWVRRFFAMFPGRRRRDLGRTEIETFLEETSRRGNVSNRQLSQARDALEIYYEQFRGIALAPRRIGMAVSGDKLPLPSVASTAKNNRNTFETALSSVNIPPSEPRQAVSAYRLPDAPVKAEGHKLLPAHGKESSSQANPVSTPGQTNWSLLEAKVKECLRVAHYSYRTEQTYVGWIRQFVSFHGWQKPSTMEAGHVSAFLKHLAEDRQVAASTQNQALNAVVFLFKTALKKEIGDFSDFQRARRGLRLPVVASREEIRAVMERLAVCLRGGRFFGGSPVGSCSAASCGRAAFAAGGTGGGAGSGADHPLHATLFPPQFRRV
jgi:hypothetical protein